MKFIFLVVLSWFVWAGEGQKNVSMEVVGEDEITRQYDLGEKYELFHPVDFLMARYWYSMAAQRGHKEARRHVQRLDEKLNIFSALKRQAQSGDKYSQYRLGTAYELGIYGAPDIYMALYWLMEAASDGQHEPAYRRYTMLMKQHKVSDEVFYLLKKAQKGDVNSQFHLAFMYEVGGDKLPSHLGSAVDWYREALAQGHAGAGQRLKLIESSSSFFRSTSSPESCMKTFH